MVIPVQDSVLARGDKKVSSGRASLREIVLEDAWEGLGLRELTEVGFCVRTIVVGLHEFENGSKASAAAGEGLVFGGEAEEACSADLAARLSELAGGCPFALPREI